MGQIERCSELEFRFNSNHVSVQEINVAATEINRRNLFYSTDQEKMAEELSVAVYQTAVEIFRRTTSTKSFRRYIGWFASADFSHQMKPISKKLFVSIGYRRLIYFQKICSKYKRLIRTTSVDRFRAQIP